MSAPQEIEKAAACKVWTCSWLLGLWLLGLGLLLQPAAGEQGAEDIGHRVGDCLLLRGGCLLRCNGGGDLCRRRGCGCYTLRYISQVHVCSIGGRGSVSTYVGWVNTASQRDT